MTVLCSKHPRFSLLNSHRICFGIRAGNQDRISRATEFDPQQKPSVLPKLLSPQLNFLFLLQRSFPMCLQISDHIVASVMLMGKVLGRIATCIKHTSISHSFTSSLMFSNYSLPIVLAPVLSDYRYPGLHAFKVNFINRGIFYPK